MCELFGINAVKKVTLNEMLSEFFSHSAEHPHGWGMAFIHGKNVFLEKQPEIACESRYLRQRLRAKICEDKMLAHIRLATRGVQDYENCHPFVLEDNCSCPWTLIHNGTIFEGDVLNPFIHVQEGQTDSERILYYIVSRVDAAQTELKRELTAEERCRLIDEIVVQLAPENKLNLILYDGERMYVHTNYKKSLHRCEKEDGVMLVSTRPLGPTDCWEEVPMNTLQVYEKGKLIYTGHDHGNEFVDSEEKMRLIFMDYSLL